MRLSERVRCIAASPTLAIAAEAQRLREAGVDVLDFSAGQPDFPTPDRVKAAGVAAIERNQTRYTATAGLPALRQAIAARVVRDRGLDVASDQVLVSPGAKACLYFACLTLIEPGDEVIVPAPYWTSYPEQIRLAGGVPLFVECAQTDGFKLDPQALAGAGGPRTRGLILNYPNNPTGACYSRGELETIAAACADRGLWIIADEIYSRLLHDGRRFASIAELPGPARDRTLVVDGMSKTWAMTGWRVGYAVGPREWIAAMSRLQDHVTSNATTISQWASLEALAMPDEDLAPRQAELAARRDIMLAALREIDGVTCFRPEGAFYAFPDVSRLLGDTLGSSAELARHLLERARVAVVPGEAFGSTRHIRFSYATSAEVIRRGMERVAEALGALAGG